MLYKVTDYDTGDIVYCCCKACADSYTEEVIGDLESTEITEQELIDDIGYDYSDCITVCEFCESPIGSR